MGERPVKARIRDKYNGLGGRLYDLRYGEEQRIKYRESIGTVRLEPWMVALDNGCGTGLLEEELDAYVVGLDLSTALLSEARLRTVSKKRVNLVAGDSESLPIRGGALHATFSFTVLQNLPHPEGALKEMRRASHPRATHIVSAHRKTMSLEELTTMVERARLKVTRVIDTERSNDWVVLAG